MTLSDNQIIHDWHEALNSGDIDRLVALCHEDVELGGPRGTERGTDHLRAWAGRAGLHLDPLRVIGSTGVFVIEQAARWPERAAGNPGELQVLATVFRVTDGRVGSIIRYPDLESALAEAGPDLTEE